MYALHTHYCMNRTQSWATLCNIGWKSSFLRITFSCTRELNAVCILCSLLVPLAAAFTGDSQHAGGWGSSAAPSPWPQREAFQVPLQGRGEGATGAVNTPFPRSVPPAVGGASTERGPWEAEESRQHKAAAGGHGAGRGGVLPQHSWCPDSHVWGGFATRSFPKGLVGGSSSGILLACTLWRQQQAQLGWWHCIDDSFILDPVQGGRDRHSSTAEWAKLLAHSFLLLPRSFPSVSP